MAAHVTPAVGVAASGRSVGLWDRLRRGTPWWAQPLAVVVVLGAFTGYSLWTSFFGPGPNHVSEHANYLSPFFSPLLWKTGPVTPALWVLWAPLGFRATCYYYRKSYYRSFFWDPPACAIGELRHRGYRGETRLPMVLNNLHRFFWYPAAIVVVLLWVDAFASFDDSGHLYLGLGTLILLVNAVLLSGYSFGCHAFRHHGGRRPRLLLLLPGGPEPLPAVADGHLVQWPPRPLGLGQHVQRGHRRGLHPPPPGRHARPAPRSSEMAEPYLTRECDVLVVGAGGAGLRAAIAAAEAGCSTIVVTKSLLGKAHTVMAEGGIAAALGNLDSPDSWEVHFADTMLGGQLVNNWRMVDALQPRGHRPRLRAGALGRPLRPHRRRPDHAAGLRRP